MYNLHVNKENRSHYINVTSAELDQEFLVVYGALEQIKTFLTIAVEFGFGYGKGDICCWLYIPLENVRGLVEI